MKCFIILYVQWRDILYVTDAVRATIIFLKFLSLNNKLTAEMHYSGPPADQKGALGLSTLEIFH